MILNKTQIKEEIEKGMVTEYKDLDIQLQPNGFDLTVSQIDKIISKGVIDFDNTHRELPKYERIRFLDNIDLPLGNYVIHFNEKLNIPSNIVALAFPRSSLIRMGATIETAVFDSGFNGYCQCLLIVSNKSGIRINKDARMIQLIFLEREDDESLYNGIYNIKEE